MRKLKLQVQMSIDGCIAGTNGEMDWMVWDWDEALKNYIKEITEPVDCIVLGRKLAEGFIPYWASHPEEEGAEKINNTAKVVFTKTLEKLDPIPSGWANTILANGNLIEEINKLKKSSYGGTKDIIVYGGAAFVSALIKEGLIDEFHLLINPTAVGVGMPIFKEITHHQDFNLLKAIPFKCGIVALCYELKRKE